MRILILLALLGSAFAFPKLANRIVGGEETTIEEHPYMTNVQNQLVNIWWQQWCGGTLLTSFHVLSAAQCFDNDDIPLSAWRVIVGTSLRSGAGGSVHQISEIISHESYSSDTLVADVAILRLAVRAVFSPAVQAARIPSETYTLAEGTALTAIGWGALTYGGVHTEQLRQVPVSVVNQELCASRYAYLKTLPGFENTPDVTDGNMCSGMIDIGGRDACTGDTGGPVAYEDDIVVGITSWGYRCGDPTYPGVSTLVSYYSNWIVDHAV